MNMKPPNFRDSENCTECKHVKCVHMCGCCPPEYVCTLYGDFPVGTGDDVLCDSFEDYGDIKYE